MTISRLCLAALALLTAAAPAAALDYRSLKEPAVMYDAPSVKATPLFVIARLTPVEVVVSDAAWLKVRDAAGGMAWVEKRVLSEARTLIVTAARAQARAKPDANAPLLFEAEKDVVLELVQTEKEGWVKVKHRDGQEAYVRANQLWGL